MRLDRDCPRKYILPMKNAGLDEQLQRLSPSGWFAGQPPELRRRLLEKAVQVRFSEGDWIYGATDEAGGLFGVLEGTVRLYAALSNGETLLLDLVGKGFWFGQIGVVRDGRRLFTAVTTEPVTALLVSRASMVQLLRENTEFVESIMQLDVVHFQYTLQVLSELLALAPRERIAARLHSLSERVSASEERHRIPLTQSDLAEMVGVERKTVNRILAEFEERGFIKRSYGAIEIYDPAALACIRDSTGS